MYGTPSNAQAKYVSAHTRKVSEEDVIEDEFEEKGPSNNESKVGAMHSPEYSAIRQQQRCDKNIRRTVRSTSSDLLLGDCSSDEDGGGAAWNRAQFKAQVAQRLEESKVGDSGAEPSHKKKRKRRKAKMRRRISTSTDKGKRFEKFLNGDRVVSV